jgi:hypothetical protein
MKRRDARGDAGIVGSLAEDRFAEEQAMNIDEFRAVCYAKEFTTFVVHLKDGRRLIVAHRLATMIYPDGRRIRNFCFLEDPPEARETRAEYLLEEIERIELRPDLPWFSHSEERWIRRAV